MVFNGRSLMLPGIELRLIVFVYLALDKDVFVHLSGVKNV